MEQKLKKDIASVVENSPIPFREKMNANEDKVTSFGNKVVSMEIKSEVKKYCKVREDIGKGLEQKFGRRWERLKKADSMNMRDPKVIFTPSLAPISSRHSTEKHLAGITTQRLYVAELWMESSS
ncbi:hypothetical protein HNY73_015721 [Argiope bruennichi]|uniref:Uncharacterized protein n=1 Tax=Argiope bruennichi TaxID=94029 RepID=A0A8T0EJW8_ARGBR|nr:hypothetical protein HNY73_015721 [Argiope bruennichi]